MSWKNDVKLNFLQNLIYRKLTVLALVAQGLRNNEIAEKPLIATATAKEHPVKIFHKLIPILSHHFQRLTRKGSTDPTRNQRIHGKYEIKR